MFQGIVRAGAVAAVAVVASGCGLLEPDPWDDRQAALDRNRAVWESAGIDSYSYELTRVCYCALAGDFIVSVTAGEVSGVVRPDGDALPQEEYEYVPTVDDLFALAQRGIDERAYRYDADYHQELGYPTVVDLDPDRNAIDEEIRTEARYLIPLAALRD